MSNDIKHLCLIDGSGYIFRAFFGLPAMYRSDGIPVNAVYGFCNMILRLISHHDQSHAQPIDAIAVIFDKSRQTFRNEIYPEYKAHRPPAPDDLAPQFDLIRQATLAFNLPLVEMDNYEADDIIATYANLATQENINTTIISSDKDLMQLVNDHVMLWDPVKMKPIQETQILEKFGVTPNKVTHVQALAGDSSDNIPGVEGIGVKTAAMLINEYGDLENLLANAHEIKQQKRREKLIEQSEMARISYKLVCLEKNTPVPLTVTDLQRQHLDMDKAVAFFHTMEFKKLIQKFDPTGRISANMSDKNINYKTTSESTQKNIPFGDYEVITDIEKLQTFIDGCDQSGKCAFKIQTNDIGIYDNDIIGIALCYDAGKSAYIPLQHQAQQGMLEHTNIATSLSPKSVFNALKPLWQNPSILKISHNIKHDISLLKQYDITLQSYDDVMLLSFTLYAGKHGHDIGLLSNTYLDHAVMRLDDICGKGKNKQDFSDIDVSIATQYMGELADMILRLYDDLKPKIAHEKQAGFYDMIERHLPQIISDMEYQGICIDAPYLKELSHKMRHELSQIEQEFHQFVREKLPDNDQLTINIASPAQLGDLLFDKLGLKGGKKGKSGAYSTASDILEPMAFDEPIIAKILQWRTIAKLLSTYTDSLSNYIMPKTGRIHTNFVMTGAQTGRLSSQDPNVQNIPIRTAQGRQIRGAFIAPKNHYILSLDYSQIELRLLAQIAHIPAMRDIFNLKDGDIHQMTASEIFNIPVDQVISDKRREAKAINFGIIYGMSAFGLSQQLEISQYQAKDIINRYFSRFPEIKTYMDNAINQAKAHGFVTTLFGRKIYLPTIQDKSAGKRQHGERQAINAKIQGSAADIIKLAMLKIPHALQQHNLSQTRMLLQVHDELLFESHEDEYQRAMQVLKETMEQAHEPYMPLNVKLVVEAGYGKNWHDAH